MTASSEIDLYLLNSQFLDQSCVLLRILFPFASKFAFGLLSPTIFIALPHTLQNQPPQHYHNRTMTPLSASTLLKIALL